MGLTPWEMDFALYLHAAHPSDLASEAHAHLIDACEEALRMSRNGTAKSRALTNAAALMRRLALRQRAKLSWPSLHAP